MQAEDRLAPEMGQPPRGRPRDPSLEARVYDAAMAVYAEAGWAGFSFEAVARAAGVGKAALYRRWRDRGDLLRETLNARWYRLDTLDEGTLRGDLTRLAETIFDALTGPNGAALLHLSADLALQPEVRLLMRPYARNLTTAARAIVRRAQARGEVASDRTPALVIDVVVGAVTNRISAAPARLRPTIVARRDQIIGELIDLVMRGLGAEG